MTRRIALAILIVLAVPCALGADTGTYRILDYSVRLSPHSDGQVTAEFYQKWSVTGGHIPWISVGMPNSTFSLMNQGGAIRGLNNNSSSGWSGVRIDLDRDYQSGETFEVRFIARQSNLFHADGENYRLSFTPGWYDRAKIDRLAITINVPAKMEETNLSPKPTRVDGQEVTWERTGLDEGAKVEVSISFPKTVMPNVTTAPPEESSGASSAGIILIVVFIIVVIIFVKLGRFVTGYGRGGSVFTGGSGGGGFFGGGGSSRSSGGGGGFGGFSSSCACACVSCACACACAGGGGAGCDRKTTHSCPLCRHRQPGRSDIPVWPFEDRQECLSSQRSREKP